MSSGSDASKLFATDHASAVNYYDANTRTNITATATGAEDIARALAAGFRAQLDAQWRKDYQAEMVQ